MDLVGFARELALMTVHMEEHEIAALEEAALIVERGAKEKIGVYQDAAGEFAAWQDLADSTKAQRVALGFSENDPLRRSGGLADSIEHMVESRTAYVGSNDPVAEYQELGTSRIPARSFLGGTAVEKGAEVAEIIGRSVFKALTGGGTSRTIE